MFDSGFRAACEATAERWEVPALAFGVSVDGRDEVVAVGCSEDSLFRVASITKPFTATLALSLLDLDSETGIWPSDVRVRHLLSHTSGFGSECADLVRFGDGDGALAGLVRDLPSVRRWLPVDEVWSYANSGYWLAGWLCAKTAGVTYEEALAEHVLGPAGLEATAFEEPTLAGTGPDAREGPFPRARRPSGGLVSTIRDLLRFGRWQLEAPWTAAARVPHARPTAGVYGLGWWGERLNGVDMWGHPGSYGGFQSKLLLVPGRAAVLVGLTNSGRGAQALREIEDEIFERLLGTRRRVPETVALTRGELAAVSGAYENDQLRAVVAADGGALHVDAEERLPTGAPGQRVSVRARPIGRQTFEILDGDWVRERFDFPRSGYARIGGRLAERVE